MILKSFLVLFLYIVRSNCLYINNKNYYIEHNVSANVSRRIIYEKSPSICWVAKSVYNKTYLSTGWDIVDIETNADIDDKDQAFLAGYLEGIETQSAIYDHYSNTVLHMCDGEAEVCVKVQNHLDTNTRWIKKMVADHAATDPYWHQVDLFYKQLSGLVLGYNSAAPSDAKLTHRNIEWITFNADIIELMSAKKYESNQEIGGEDHCSALIKIVQGQTDILVSQNMWTGYETMMRIIKRYTLRFKNVKSTSMSFSGYPGALASGDDFYIMNSGLIAQETTNRNTNGSLWLLVKPIGQVLEVVRLTVANQLADGGRSWSKIFSQYNSGTYNNQWMIVDMNKFSPGVVQPELLWVLEQMPGYIRSEDQTAILRQQGYWASYNRPFYPDIFNMSGNQPLVTKYGDFFSYDKTPRALIFKRDEGKVHDVNTMMTLMRSNDFQHDPLSRCNECNPPFSSENAIASRSDLNPVNGTYPFRDLGHRPRGATDAKVTSYKLAKTLSFLAVSGPTTGTNLPPFQWSKSDFNQKLSHRGHPDIFHFEPVLISWPNLGKKTVNIST